MTLESACRSAALPPLKRADRGAHVLRILREHRGSYLSTHDVQQLVDESRQGYRVRAVLDALHAEGLVSRLKRGRKSRPIYTWAVPA